ncbi:hypothetical protein [Magnetospirillum sp. SS-4]|uniref:hypothetical protein n=1 Tax=Magnetospirillum sp. SS-4 TaxID=2681465 RepID=UPI00137E16E1|nr:hypothetical protein [Magnetospirillum sp. SS-4]CAA7619038.1 hypothetical protein MTBSS4_230030 [Magnetospirillum sp. SS-4]
MLADNAWSRFLLSRLDAELASGAALGLPVDAALIGSAHVLHGAQLAIHGGLVARPQMAEYLRSVADAVEMADPHLPYLVSLGA